MDQTQNDLLREWLDCRDMYLQQMLEGEGPPLDSSCLNCGALDATINCSDCIAQAMTCPECAVGLHQDIPFHRISRWNSRYYEKESLFDLGLIVHLGHVGKPCPQQDNGKESAILVAHTTGYHHLRVLWCKCPGKEDHAMQLFSHRLFPASFKRTQTVFTFDVLDHFYLDAMECKTPAMSFHAKLQRLTCSVDPGSAPVSSYF